MLQPIDNPLIETKVCDVDIGAGAHLHVKILRHAEEEGPTLLLIHGG